MKKLTFTLALAVLTLAVFAQTSRRQDNSGKITNKTSLPNRSENNFRKNGNAANITPEVKRASDKEKRRGSNNSNNDYLTGQRNDNKRNEQKKADPDYHIYRNNNNYGTRNNDNTYAVSDNKHNDNNRSYSDREVHTQKIYTTPRRRIVVDNDHISYHRVETHKKYHENWREPVHIDIIWTKEMYHEYLIIYPFVEDWSFRFGSQINTIAACDAQYHVGEIVKVFGKVADVFYSAVTDEYFLFIGDYYPWQDITIILPGHIVRSRCWNPELYFKYEFISVTGYITYFDDKPEIAIKKGYQFSIY
jgi:hypothetical protein